MKNKLEDHLDKYLRFLNAAKPSTIDYADTVRTDDLHYYINCRTDGKMTIESYKKDYSTAFLLHTIKNKTSVNSKNIIWTLNDFSHIRITLENEYTVNDKTVGTSEEEYFQFISSSTNEEVYCYDLYNKLFLYNTTCILEMANIDINYDILDDMIDEYYRCYNGH